MTRPVTIIYHANCPDGFGAAVAAWLFFKQQPGYKKNTFTFIKVNTALHRRTVPIIAFIFWISAISVKICRNFVREHIK